MTGFALTERHGEWLSVEYDGVELCRYVYEPRNAQLESPHPYFHPMRTLDGALSLHAIRRGFGPGALSIRWGHGERPVPD